MGTSRLLAPYSQSLIYFSAQVVNGFYLYLPLVDLAAQHEVAAAWWAFAGGTLFELGSYLMVVEALNTGHETLFGPALWGSIEHDMAMGRRVERRARGKGGLGAKDADREALNASGENRDARKFRWM
jgi:hypothetical protein